MGNPSSRAAPPLIVLQASTTPEEEAIATRAPPRERAGKTVRDIKNSYIISSSRLTNTKEIPLMCSRPCRCSLLLSGSRMDSSSTISIEQPITKTTNTILTIEILVIDT